MIEMFKDNEMRNSGLVYSSTLEQIKQLYAVDPEQAGELAISAIELVLTGDISSDDMMISMLLTPMKKINENNHAKYDSKVENQRQKKIVEMKLDKVAELMVAGYKQREIAERLNMSQQNVSYRWNLIKSTYPELLQTNFTNLQTNLTSTLQTTYKNTNNTNNSNFVPKNVCKNSGEEAPEGENASPETVYTKDFRF